MPGDTLADELDLVTRLGMREGQRPCMQTERCGGQVESLLLAELLFWQIQRVAHDR